MSTPIVALDHISIATRDLEAAAADYARLLGCEALSIADGSGGRRAVFDAGNLHVVLRQCDSGQTGLSDVCFRVDDLPRLRRRCQRLAMAVEPSASADPLAALRHGSDGHLDRLAPASARGLGLQFVEGGVESASGMTGASAAATLTGLDHLVVHSSDAVATAFLLGSQLGLDLRMDLSNPRWDARLMFFRCGDLIVEVFQSLGEGQARDDAAPGTDRFYGLSWRVREADAARGALAGAGVDVSPVREGRKPGTRVFTVRDHTAGVATLMLEPPADRR